MSNITANRCNLLILWQGCKDFRWLFQVNEIGANVYTHKFKFRGLSYVDELLCRSGVSGTNSLLSCSFTPLTTLYRFSSNISSQHLFRNWKRTDTPLREMCCGCGHHCTLHCQLPVTDNNSLGLVSGQMLLTLTVRCRWTEAYRITWTCNNVSDKFREEFLGVGLLSTVQDVQSIVSPSNDKDTI